MESESNTEIRFTQRYLPWVVAGVALVLYLATLATGITPLGLGATVRAGGWTWQPQLVNPLTYLVTWPIDLLPVNWQVTGLNALSAIFSALALALLARSVALLPHDRTRDQRQFERSENANLSIKAAWIPPVLAVMVCGLQRSFWEHAIVGTGEALDLLVFAYVLRCLLEFRIEQRESWLNKMAVVYGVGVTNNFALIGFFPAVLGALIWIRGRSFFNLRFCVRMFLLGLAGLSLYLLFPLLQVSNKEMGMNLWELLRVNLGMQKNLLLRFPRFMLIIIGLSSLLPIAFIGIKWPANFGDISTVGNFLTNVMTHALHGAFLIFCAYVAFDFVEVPISPRNMVGLYGYHMLLFYYLGALSIGYFSGYLLLVFGSAPLRAWQRPSPIKRLLNQGIVGIVWLAVFALPAGLVLRNLPQIQATGSKYLEDYGNNVARQLRAAAPQGAIVLSDDHLRLFATLNALKEQGVSEQYPLLDTSSFKFVPYLRYLHRTYPKVWPEVPTNVLSMAVFEPLNQIQVLTYHSQSNAIFYLHPSFGYYFEKFYPIPNKLLYQLKTYPSNEVEIATFTEPVVHENDQFWKELRNGPLKRISAAVKSGHDQKEINQSLMLMGMLYARNLNWFGVQLQKAGQLEKAAEYFSAALEVNPENPAALVNLEFNKALRSGKTELTLSQATQNKLANYHDDLETLMKYNGPLDAPRLCFQVAGIFAQGNNFRQAAQNLQRTLKFEPENLPARLGMISLLNQIHQSDQALQMIASLRAEATTKPLPAPAQMDLLQSEASAYLGKNQFTISEKLLTKAMQDYPTNAEPYVLLANLYVNAKGDITNAFKVFESQMKAQPNEPSAYINSARLKIMTQQFAEAIPHLDRALQLRSHDPDALLNRAIAHLKLGHLDAAEQDYNELYNLLPKKVYPVIYGLHEVYWLKKNRQYAMKWGKDFLDMVPAKSPDAQRVIERLKRLKSGAF